MGWRLACYHHHWEKCQVDGAIPAAPSHTCSSFDLGWRPSLFYAAGVVQWFLDSYELGESGEDSVYNDLPCPIPAWPPCPSEVKKSQLGIDVALFEGVLLSPLPPYHLVAVYPEVRNFDTWKGLSYYCPSLQCLYVCKYTKDFQLYYLIVVGGIVINITSSFIETDATLRTLYYYWWQRAMSWICPIAQLNMLVLTIPCLFPMQTSWDGRCKE